MKENRKIRTAVTGKGMKRGNFKNKKVQHPQRLPPHAHLEVINRPVKDHASDLASRIRNGPLNGEPWKVVFFFVCLNGPINTLFQIPACLIEIASHDVDLATQTEGDQ